MSKPDAAARKAELARNPKSAQVVVSSADDKFLNEALGVSDEGGVLDAETGEFTETEEGMGDEGIEVTQEEIAALEEKMGRKLTDEEITELTAIKKEEAEGVGAEGTEDDFEFIKPEDLPKELQPHFKRMFASFTKKMQGISELRRKAELFDYFSTNPEMAKRMLAGETTPEITPKKGKIVDEDAGEAEDSFVKQLNLPEDNELTPAVAALAKLMVKGFGEVRAGREQDSQNELRKSVKSYFEQNPDLLKDQELCVTMDRIGVENPNLYRNMPRLRKYAEAELGRPAKVAKEEAKVTLSRLYKSMKTAKKSAVTKPSVLSERGAQTSKTKDVADAFERALNRVKLKYGKRRGE